MARYWNARVREASPRPVEPKQRPLTTKQRWIINIAGLIFLAVFFGTQGALAWVLVLAPFVLIGLALRLLWRAWRKKAPRARKVA